MEIKSPTQDKKIYSGILDEVILKKYNLAKRNWQGTNSVVSVMKMK